MKQPGERETNRFVTNIVSSLRSSLKRGKYGNPGRLVLKRTGFFSAWASKLNTGLINKGCYGMFVACGIWPVADVSSVSPSSEQSEGLSGNQCLNSW